MSDFNYQDTEDGLIIDLPDELKYGFSFLNNITEMLENVAQGKYNRILLDCPHGAVYDKMSKAYLFNVLIYLTESSDIFWSKALSEIIAPNIQKKPGSQFEPVEMIQRCVDENLEYYEFENNDSVSAPVNEMARLLVEENLIINSEII